MAKSAISTSSDVESRKSKVKSLKSAIRNPQSAIQGRFVLFGCLAILSLALIDLPSLAQTKLLSKAEKTQDELLKVLEKEDVVEVYALKQHYDDKTGMATLEGAVDIRFGEVRLRADKMTVNRRTMETVATGNIILEYQENRIVGDRLEMNLSTRLGKVYSAQAFLEPSYFLTAKMMERFSLDKYRVDGATFTTCSQDVPDWSFKMKRATIHVDNYIYLSHGSMWVKKMPIIYLPYWIYPVKPDRTTGFLMPEFGSSTRLGNYMKNSFFWATTDNTDATFSLEGYDRGTFAESVEFRYVLSPTAGGNLYAFHVSEKQAMQSYDTTSVFNNPRERWQVSFQHAQDLGKGFRGTADVNYLSDKEFGEDYIWNLSDQPQEIVAKTSVTKSWSQYYLSANVVHIESLDNNDPTDTLLEKLPEINLVGMRQQIWDTPVFFQFSAQAASLAQTSSLGEASIERKTNRFDLYPQLTYPLNIGQWLSITGRVGFRTTWYIDSSMDLSDMDVEGLGKVKTYSFIADNSETITGRKDGEIFDKEHPFERVVRNDNDVRREIYDCSLSCSGPSVHRILSFSGWGNIDKVEHLITPSVSFDYIPAVNQSLLYQVDLSNNQSGYWYPLNYDGTDYIGMITAGSLWGRGAATYSLSNRLRAKIIKPTEGGEPTTEYRDLLTFTLSQSYDFKVASYLKKDLYTPYRTDYSPFSDVRASATMRPTDTLGADMQLNYNPHKSRISDYTLAANYKIHSWRAQLRYRVLDRFRPHTDAASDDSSYADTRYLTAELGCAPHPKWEFYTTVNYDIAEDMFNQNNYTVVYHSQCWALTFFAGHETTFEWKNVDGEYRKTTRDDTKFSLSIALENVGSSKVPFL
ncbi:MAG: LPS-assembly protein LptD [Candidatus Coatesbacteria bacterium]|nr:LPS-assembly protein LptD [Candidatus Coatesbacteria bacterium]